MRKYYVGIDGGGTYTKAVVVSCDGELIFRTAGETVNFCAVRFDTARKNLEDVISRITEVIPEEEIAHVFIGCSALESKADADTTKRLMGRYSNISADMDSDLYVALYGHSFGKQGAMIVSGTGSMGVAITENGSIITCGGWGYAFGDEGSAYYIAVEGLRYASKMADGREEKTKLYYAALKHYGVDDLYKIIDALYLPEYSRNKVADFSKVVAQCADEGDSICESILDNAARELCSLSSALLRRSGKYDTIAVYGGVLQNNRYVLSRLTEYLSEEFPGISVVPPAALPEFGAVAAAMNADGILNETLIKKLCILKQLKNKYKEIDMRYVYPKLKKIDSRDGECLCKVKLSGDIERIAKQVGLDFGTHDTPTHTLTLEPLSAYGESVYSNEQFAAAITENTITLYADTERTASYALKRVYEMQKYGKIKMGKFRDWPSTPRRGIIEGFYGKPWSLEQEVDAIHNLWENGMNTYIYSPKDDEYHRAKWSELYPEDKLTNLLTLLHTCDKNYVDFYYMLAPGLSIKYSSESDFDLLMRKYRQIYDLGVRHLGLLLDDIPKELIHDEDKEKYTDYCEAHIELCLKAYNALKEIDPTVSFTICPTVYRGDTAQDYIVRMGKAMPEDVSIFWTGPAVCSFDLTENHTAAFLKNTGHRPLYWDNYPVNDYTMLHEMHIEPIRFRDYGLAKLSDGVIANVMEYMEASMLSVITYAHFLWEPNAYDQNRSYSEAIEQRLGTSSVIGAQIFMEFCYKSYISYHYNEKFSRLLLMKETPCDILTEYARYCKLELVRLRDNCENRAFVKEVGRWLDKAILFCDIVCGFCDKNKDRAKLREELEAYLADPTEICRFEAELMLEKI